MTTAPSAAPESRTNISTVWATSAATPSWHSRIAACSRSPPPPQGLSVTVSLPCGFLDAARRDELVEGSGEITRAGGSLIFLRGILKSGDRPLFTFSSTIKGVKRLKSPT